MKKITNQQILGEMGVNLIQSIVLKMGFAWHASNQAVEAGIDGWVELRDAQTGEVANCWLAVQSRARSEVRENDTTVKYTCTMKDAEYWLKGNQPVILVLSVPGEDLAWWVSVKDYFHGKDVKNDRMIVFDKTRQRLTPSTAEEWKALGNKYGAGSYFAPPEKKETLTSNLLEVSRFQKQLFYAETKLSSDKEIRDRLKEHIDWPPWEWFYGQDKRIYSFHNLTAPPWTEVSNTDSVSDIPTETLASSADPNDRRSFVRLLNGCLRQIVGTLRMRYSPEGDCFYFKPARTDVVRDLYYKSRKKKTSRAVVRRYFGKKDTTRIAYYRHDAFEHRFLRFGDAWYLMVEPTYVFTTDGKEPDPYREERLSKIKSIEGDAALSGKIVMYSDLLRDRSSLFDEPYGFLGFDGIESACLGVGIDDDAWARIKAPVGEKVTANDDSTFGAGLFD